MQLAAAAAPDAAKAPPRPASRLFAILLVPALLAVVLVFDDEILALKGLRGLRTHVRSRIGLPTYGQASPLVLGESAAELVPDQPVAPGPQPPADEGEQQQQQQQAAVTEPSQAGDQQQQQQDAEQVPIPQPLAAPIDGSRCGDYCSAGKVRSYIGDIATPEGLGALLDAATFNNEVRGSKCVHVEAGDSPPLNPPRRRMHARRSCWS